MSQKRGVNGQFVSAKSEPLAKDPLMVRMPMSLDEIVRSLPNRSEWIRNAIIEQLEREGLAKTG